VSESLASWIVTLAGAYLVVGLVIAAMLVWRGLGRLDPVAAHGTWGFRLLVLPGVVALWPLLLSRWVRGLGQPPVEHNAHRDTSHQGSRR
jgi:hypothetical protein